VSELAITRDTVTGAAGTAVVLRLRGALDLHTGPDARDALQAVALHAGDLLVLDLAELTVCDSTGISVLVAARDRVLAAGAGIALAAVPAHVARRLHIVGLATVFPMHPSVTTATTAWQPESM
jgi:anti-anti-sigma factor